MKKITTTKFLDKLFSSNHHKNNLWYVIIIMEVMNLRYLLKDNKELLIVPDPSHCDLYDQKDIIPFDKIEIFLKDNLKWWKKE